MFYEEQNSIQRNELTCRKKKSPENGMRDEKTEAVDVAIVLIVCWIPLTEASKCGWSSFILARNTLDTLDNSLDAYQYCRRCYYVPVGNNNFIYMEMKAK